VKNGTDRMLAPLGRAGTVKARDVVYRIQEILLPVKGMMHWEAGFLGKAIEKLDILKEELAKVGAKDPHGLSRYHQAEGLLFTTEIMLKAALMREESRGDFHRIDYPNRDDEDWMKWIVIEQKGGKERLFTEPVPIEKYRLRPPVK
jgi:succinate dehydrogenase/fumarate reductase flavoprotein subunit